MKVETLVDVVCGAIVVIVCVVGFITLSAILSFVEVLVQRLPF